MSNYWEALVTKWALKWLRVRWRDIWMTNFLGVRCVFTLIINKVSTLTIRNCSSVSFLYYCRLSFLSTSHHCGDCRLELVSWKEKFNPFLSLSLNPVKTHVNADLLVSKKRKYHFLSSCCYPTDREPSTAGTDAKDHANHFRVKRREKKQLIRKVWKRQEGF